MPRSVGGVVVARHLVGDVGLVARDAEAVREADRDEELAAVLVAQLERLVLAVGGRVAAQVDRHVVDRAARARGPASPGRAELEVQRADRPAHRARVVVLDELGTRCRAPRTRRGGRSRRRTRGRRRSPSARPARARRCASRARLECSRSAASGRTGAGSTRGSRRSGSAPTTRRCRGTSRRSRRCPPSNARPAPSSRARVGLLRAERVAAVVAGTVLDVLDQRLVARPSARGSCARRRCSEARRGRRCCRSRRPSPSRSTMSSAAAVVGHVQPVAHLHPVAVDGQRVAVQRVQDAQRDQLLRVLVGAVVVRRAADDRVHPVGVAVGATRPGRRRPSRPSTGRRGRAGSAR